MGLRKIKIRTLHKHLERNGFLQGTGSMVIGGSSRDIVEACAFGQMALNSQLDVDSLYYRFEELISPTTICPVPTGGKRFSETYPCENEFDFSYGGIIIHLNDDHLMTVKEIADVMFKLWEHANVLDNVLEVLTYRWSNRYDVEASRIS